MEKTYQPETIEKKWYPVWENKGYFKPTGDGTPYCIMIPPPNVTGSLHMGHGFQNTLMDALIRHKRMQGYRTLWQVGTDHAGIATQMMVERLLAQEGKDKHALGRENFVARIWEWKKFSGNTITKQLRRLGVSVDWSRERFTMDEELSYSVREVFVRLHEEGLIYRGPRLVNWDPVLQTAISDLEVSSQEEQGHLWHLRYPVSDGSGFVVVATTRPETMLGDTAVAVHPDDERYQHLHGKFIRLPLVDREIPIITDPFVDQTFGSGCVKITPGHDFSDYEVGKRHQLPIISIFDREARFNDSVPENFRGLDRTKARKHILESLQQLNLIEKIESHVSKIPRGDRSGTIIEPMITDQWFVRCESLAKEALDVVKNGDIRFVPDHWTKTYDQWLENIEDWCVSRQLWWGHRIPAWFDENNKVYVGRTLEEAREKYKLDPALVLRQDEDVLDTWFSSALWPFSTLGWPNKNSDFDSFYPTQVLVTGFDIIFFWVARMIMMGLKFTGKIPFHEVYITGLIRDAEGQKMSKSKGNVIDPIDLIDGISLPDLIHKNTQGMMQPQLAKKVEKYLHQQFKDGIPAFGTDALRFTFCSLATSGRDINFDLDRMLSYRNFCNKLWNAARYVLQQCESFSLESTKVLNFSLSDRWLRSRHQRLIQTIDKHFSGYRFDLLAQAAYEFVWDEFCDWGLELSKPVLYQTEDADSRYATLWTLLSTLESTLRLLHPLMPFITEEIWQRVKEKLGLAGESIMLESYPVADASLIDESAEQTMQTLQGFITAIRTLRSENNLPPAEKFPCWIAEASSSSEKLLKTHQDIVHSQARLQSLTFIEKSALSEQTLAGHYQEWSFFIPIPKKVYSAAEREQLKSDIEKLRLALERSETKMKNPEFCDKAPPAVVEKERRIIEELSRDLAKAREKWQLAESS